MADIGTPPSFTEETVPNFLRDSGLGSATSELRESSRELGQARRRAGEKIAQVQADKSSLPVPQMQEIPPPPEFQPRGFVEGFGSVAMTIAALGGLLTRAPLTTSLNAAGAALSAMQSNDLEMADREYKRWKGSTDNAVRLHEFQMQAYDTAIKRLDGNRDAALAELEVYAASFKDEGLLLQVQQGNVKGALDYLDSQRRMWDSLRTEKQRGEQLFLDAARLRETQRYHDAEIVERQADRTSREGIATQRTQATEQKVADKSNAKREEAASNYDSAVDQVDQLVEMAKTGSPGGVLSGVTGLSGMVNRGVETVKGVVSSGPTPASDFESALSALKLQMPKLLTGSSKSAKDERAQIDRILRGTSAGDTRDKTVNALQQIKDLLQARRDAIRGGREPVDGADDAGGPPPAAAAPDKAARLDQARALIKRGAPRSEVDAALRAVGIDPAELD